MKRTLDIFDWKDAVTESILRDWQGAEQPVRVRMDLQDAQAYASRALGEEVDISFDAHDLRETLLELEEEITKSYS